MIQDTDKRRYDQYSKRELEVLKEKDPWLFNKILNQWEQYSSQTVVASYPLDLSIPFIDGCNARCVFCSYWGCRPRFMSETELDEYKEVFKYLAYVGINPAGEPLLHPQFEVMIQKIKAMVDPRCSFYLVTNGINLQEKQDAILDSVDSLTISLNAATQRTHFAVVGIDNQFGKIIAGIKELVAEKKQQKKNMAIYATFVVLSENIDEIPHFIQIAEEIGIDRIYFRNLANGNENNPIKPGSNPAYGDLQPHLHPDFEKLKAEAIVAIRKAAVDIVAEPEQWGQHIASCQAAESRTKRSSPSFVRVATRGDQRVGCKHGEWVDADPDYFPYTCQYLYKYMIDPRISNIQPVCVYMETLPGFDPIALDLGNMMRVRNAPAMQALRKALREGPVIPVLCTECNILNAFKQSAG